MSVFVAYIKFDQEIPVHLRDLIEKLNAKLIIIDLRALRVDYERKRKPFGYEFSGYQAAINELVGKRVARGNPDGNERFTIIFFNDTAIKKHIWLLTSFLSKRLIKIAYALTPGEKKIIGIQSKIPGNLFGDDGPYITSWCFMITGIRRDLGRRLVFDGECGEAEFVSQKLNELPGRYVTKIHSWLRSPSIIRGWKAGPATDKEFSRKCYSIYLEHTLVDKMKRSGVSPIDLKTKLSLPDRIILILLLNLDRAKIKALIIRDWLATTVKKANYDGNLFW